MCFGNFADKLEPGFRRTVHALIIKYWPMSSQSADAPLQHSEWEQLLADMGGDAPVAVLDIARVALTKGMLCYLATHETNEGNTPREVHCPGCLLCGCFRLNVHRTCTCVWQ